MGVIQPLALTLIMISALLIGIGSWAMQSVAQEKPTELCMGDEIQEEVRAIALKAIDEALKQHIVHIFDTWMKDPSDQPKRAVTGFRIGVGAYLRSRTAIDKWDPPLCPGG
jgi:hypothetical protein